VDKLIRQNKGKEETLIQQVKAKYCPTSSDASQDKCAELIKQLKTSNQLRIDDCDRLTQEHRKQMILMEHELAQSKLKAEEVPRLEAEVAAAKQQIQSLQAVQAELGTIKDVTKNTTAMSGEVVRLNGVIKEMEKKLALADREGERHCKEMEKAKRNAEIEADKFCRAAEREAERQVRDAKAEADKRIREVEKEIGDAGRHASRREAERNALEKQLSKLAGVEQSEAQLKQENAKLRAEIQKLTQNTKVSKQTKADKQVSDAQTQLNTAREQLRKEREYSKELEAEVSRLNSICDSLQAFREEATSTSPRAKSVPKLRPHLAGGSKIQNTKVVAGVRTISDEQL